MRFHDDDRAARNMVGFTLTFAIIVISVGLVATFGYQNLGAISQGERIDNAEQGMDLVATNFQQLQQQRAVVRSNELSLSSGSLTVINGSSVTVGVVDTNFNETIPLGGLTYEYENTRVTYENGALFRTESEGHTAALRRSMLTCRERQAVVSLVTVEPESTDAIDGDYATVTGTVRSHDLLFPANRSGDDSIGATDEVNVTFSSPRSDAWGRQLSESGNWTLEAGSDDTYICDGVEAVYVRQSVVSVSFEN